MNAGVAFANVSDKGNSYLNVSFNEEFKEVCPVFKTLKMTLFEINESERKENSPYYRVEVLKIKPKDD